MDEEAGLTLCGPRAVRHLPPSFRAGLRRRGVEVIPSAEIVSRYAVAAPAMLRPNGLELTPPKQLRRTVLAIANLG